MIRRTTITILLTLLVTVEISAQKSSTTDRARDETAIRANVAQMEKGWNIKSGSEFAKPFATDADYVVIDGVHIRGRAANAAGHQQIFDTVFKKSKIAIAVESIRFIRPDVAIVHVKSTLLVDETDPLSAGSGRITLVMANTNGNWSISAFQNTLIRPAAGVRR